MSIRHRKILLVDDEPLILESLSRELTEDNLEVNRATNGEEAITAIEATCFDLVVTDLVMPGVDGFQVLKAAKQRDARTMVIILTGYGNMESAVDALRLGADDFLQKPCEIEELRYRMANCFVKQDLERKVAFYETILPVCSWCRKIRDDRQEGHGQGQWYSLEAYLKRVKGVDVSHGCCPECFALTMKNIARDKSKGEET
ncbi:response regulator [Desulfobulbus alkaliphilus]|uniref:response regulator n=1 Tax=Desulfobulbus alkaliphilus TaxID=869814 RepID=UPI0019643741|nr:response regulator [Desulfobulbus alkaliphilus]MBM9537667.1 response regulator [Desulfobulbus alkaliphilus]